MSARDVFFGEYVGTSLLLLLGTGVAAAVTLPRSKARHAGWVAVALGWGLAVLAAAYVALPLSGAHLNPAVTLGKAVVLGGWGQVPLYVAGQLLGAATGAVLAWIVYIGHFREHPGPSLEIFATAPAIRNRLQNLATETAAGFTLVFVVLAVGETRALVEVGTDALVVALVVAGIILALGGPTGVAMNPARDLGPRLVYALLPVRGKQGADWRYAWVPVVGPLLGGLLAGLLDRTLYP